MESVVTQPAQQAGFTLIELMIVIVIVAIFVTVGVPSFQNLVRDNRLSTQANSLVSSLQLARSEALKLRTPVSICRSTDGASCAAGTATTWESGWVVYQDIDASNSLNAGDNVVQTKNSLGSGNTLRAAGGFNTSITYLPNGLFVPTGSANAASGTFRLCDGNDPDVTQGRLVTISITGRVQSNQGGLASCP